MEGFTRLWRGGAGRLPPPVRAGDGRRPIWRFAKSTSSPNGRDPTLTEIRMIDTYWSDHCRHTTFLTEFTDVRFDDARGGEGLRALSGIRAALKRSDRPVTLMDMATVGARYLKLTGALTDLDESQEINACTVKLDVETDKGVEKWLLLVQERDAQPPHGDRALRRRGHLHRRSHPRPALRARLRLSGHARHRRGRPHPAGRKHHRRQAAPAHADHHGGGGGTAPTATRSAWPRGWWMKFTTPATPPSAWRSARWWAQPRPRTCAARRPPRATAWCCWAGAPAATAAAARPAPANRTPRTLWRPAARRCRRATPPRSASCKGCSATPKPQGASSAATTLAPAAFPWPSANWPTGFPST